MKQLPSQSRLLERLSYDQVTGDLMWRTVESFNSRVRLGDLAGCRTARGYYVLKFDGVIYYVHRLIWKMVTGVDPENEIDHCNGDCTDNRWMNLRSATSSENKLNRRKNLRSLHKGVTFHKRDKKWQASIGANGRKFYLGYFDTATEAHEVYAEAAIRMHGEFAKVA